MSIGDQISADFKDSRLNWKVMLAFIPISFLSYLFHELGHWTFGEMLGTDMSINLNNAGPKSGIYLKESHALWSAIGGPLFTIFQALIFLLIVQKTKSAYAFSIMFFAGFLRIFSLAFGGLSLQDEARISAMLHINKFVVPAIVIVIFLAILWWGSRQMKFQMKEVGYYTVFSTLAIILVIEVNKLII